MANKEQKIDPKLLDEKAGTLYPVLVRNHSADDRVLVHRLVRRNVRQLSGLKFINQSMQVRVGSRPTGGTSNIAPND